MKKKRKKTGGPLDLSEKGAVCSSNGRGTQKLTKNPFHPFSQMLSVGNPNIFPPHLGRLSMAGMPTSSALSMPVAAVMAAAAMPPVLPAMLAAGAEMNSPSPDMFSAVR